MYFTKVSELKVLCLTTLEALASKVLVSPCCLMLCSPKRIVRAATSLRFMLQSKIDICIDVKTIERSKNPY